MENSGSEDWLRLEREILLAKVNDRRFVDFTAYEGVALWWFTRFRLFNPAKSTEWVRGLTRNTYTFALANFVYDLSTAVICRAMSWVIRNGHIQKKPTILITVNDRDWKTWRSSAGRLIKGDVFFDSLIRELQRRGFRIVTTTSLRSPIGGLETMLERLKHQEPNLAHTEFNIFWAMKTWKMENDARKCFRNAWKTASKIESLVRVLQKSGLHGELPYYFNSIFGYVAKCLEVAKKMVAEVKPDLILLSSEHGIVQKSLMVAGRRAGIPTMALQHGLVGQSHRGYISWEGSISESGSIESPYCPIPDKTAVFGPYYFRLLTEKSDYPPTSVAVTGQPRYDALVMADKVYSREVFCRNLGLDPARRVALVATENVPIPEGQAFLRSVLRASTEFPELQVVVKPHPAERGNWYTKVIKGVTAVVLSKDSDTYEAFYSCDIFFADYSTVILEAIILGKIGVTLHLGKGKDPAPFFKDVTFRVYKEEDLVPAIRKALYDEDETGKLRTARQKFVYDHHYRQDGKATERVADLVEEMIKRRHL